MPDLAEITENDRRVLETVACGHRERMTISTTRHGISKQISALTSNEIQVALNASFSEIADCIAHLVANDYIHAGRQYPSFWGWLKGESVSVFFSVTPAGEAFLKTALTVSRVTTEFRDEKLKSATEYGEYLARVEAALYRLGYKINFYGIGITRFSFVSGYSPCETASHLALSTLALDIKEGFPDIRKMMRPVPNASAMFHILVDFKNAGLMREELVENDARAIFHVITPGKHQLTWISQVLSDPLIAQNRVANLRNDFSKSLDRRPIGSL